MDKVQLQLLHALYGSGQGPTSDEIEKSLAAQRAERSQRESEGAHQVRFHFYLKSHHIPHFAPFNEGHLSMCADEEQRERMGRKASNMGMAVGICDFVIPIARRPYHGLYIELKARPHGKVSGAQQWWLETLVMQNYRALVSWSYEESVQILADYLALPAWPASLVESELEEAGAGSGATWSSPRHM